MQRACASVKFGSAVAARAIARALEHRLAARCRSRVEAAGRRCRRGERQLIRLQRGQLVADAVLVAVGDAQVQARLGERAEAAHLRHRDVAVPVRDLGAVAGEGDAVDAGQAVGGRDHGRLVQAVDVEPRVVLAPAPGVERRLGRRVERRRQRDDRADVEIAIRPAVEPLADAGRERVVHGRVAERAGDADARQRVDAVDRGRPCP